MGTEVFGEGESVADGNRRLVKGERDGEHGGVWGLVAVRSSNDDARNGIDEGSIEREPGTSLRDGALFSAELTGFNTVLSVWCVWC